MDKNNTQDPLANLVISDSQAINRQELAHMLRSFILIDDSTKRIEFLPEIFELDNDTKVEVILAASKARNLLFEEEGEKLTPKNIIDLDIAPEGSIKTSIKRLLAAKRIRVEKGKYYLPNYKIAQLCAKLTSKDHGGE